VSGDRTRTDAGPGGSLVPGLVPFTFDPATGRVLAEITDGLEVLLTSHLVTGLGSSGLSFDRGMQGRTQHVRFERRGPAMTLVRLNRKWRARGTAAEREAGEASFVRSIVWTAPVEEARGGAAVVDITTLLLRDHLGIAPDLAAAGEGTAVVDPARSFADPETSSGHPTHTELSGWITLAVEAPGPKLTELAPDPRSLSFAIRLTLLALPTGFEPRVFDPSSGGYGKGFDDMAAHPADGTAVMLQPRFRATADAPIVFNVDPGIPEPYRSAVVEGGNWWARAFDAAGMPGHYRVRVLPEGVDAFAAGTNMVWWVHRTGRGWSRAAASVDTRTGEIVHANVRLGSQRVHQLTGLFEALLSPYGRPDEQERLAHIEAAVVTRIKHLAAHEIGHALGFVHNYASTTHGTPSVMDYPHPRLRVTRVADGAERIDLDDAYTPSLGEWDVELVRRAYGPEQHAGPRDVPLPFVSDLDGHGPDASVPDGVPWVFGSDPLASLDTILRVREIALREFGEGSVKPGRQLGDLEGRFFQSYLLHRHQAAAVARLIGGASYRYGLVGQAEAGTTPEDPTRQRAALDRLLALLRPEVLRVPSNALRVLTPPSLRFPRSPDAATPAAGPVLDTARAVEIAAGVVLEHCFPAGRLNRLWDQRHAGLDVPTVAGIVDAAWAVVFSAEASAEPAIAAGAGWALARHVVAGLERPALHPWARSEMIDRLRALCSIDAARTTPIERGITGSLLRYCETRQIGELAPTVSAPTGTPL
jgi:hypothetical protein